MRKFLIAVPVIAVALGSGACATKKYVKTTVDPVNNKVDTLTKTVEQTQERTKANEGKIAEVDQKAGAAAQSAAQANQAAAAANNAANAVGAKADARADAIEKSVRKLVFEAVLSESSGNFKFGKTDLPDEAKAKIDDIVKKLKADTKNVYIEIEGHTDNIGAPELNQQIGLKRAEAVKRYLYEQYQIPLHKMNVISYGQDKPAAPNTTKAGREQNRRVVIKILA